MKFLCDQMLAGLGRWLRIAGYDTVIIGKTVTDRDILEKAIKENRILLTRDRHFLEMHSPEKTVIFLNGNSLEEWVQELSHQLKINWLYHPFSRCLLCNSLLIHPNSSIILERVPEDIRAKTKEFWYCQQCQKMYWHGGHTKRMSTQLKKWEQTNNNSKGL